MMKPVRTSADISAAIDILKTGEAVAREDWIISGVVTRYISFAKDDAGKVIKMLFSHAKNSFIQKAYTITSDDLFKRWFLVKEEAAK